MQALLVRAHETDTNAWYPVAPSHSPGPAPSVDSAAALTPINYVVRRSSSERQAKVQKKIVKGSARAMRAMGRARRDASNSNARGKSSGSCERRDGHPKIRTKRNAITHLSPGSRGPVFLRNRRQKGEGFCCNGPCPLPADRGLASAGARADDPLRLPSLRYALTPKLRCALLALAGPPSPP